MKKLYNWASLAIVLLISSSAYSITHVVTQTGFTFNPQSLEVEVGDIINWVWTGGNHNTTSISVPSGADTWASPLNSGNPQFQYEVTVAGTYAYVCTFHSGSGMTGGFVASETAVSCTINPVIVQDENLVTVSINGMGATDPLYAISWGDESFASNLPEDSHTYENEGTYEICITYLDQANSGCMINDCSHNVTIDNIGVDECTVEMTIAVDAGSVTVTAVGSGVQDGQYSISWGDESTTNASSGTHTYLTSDSYTICVSYGLFMPGGCVAEDCETIEVTVAPPVECELEMDITSEGGLDVLLVASGNGASNPHYSVNWGDDSPLETNPNGSHTYNEDGTYTICVVYSDLDDPDNCVVQECSTVTVSIVICEVTLSLTNTDNVYSATAVGTGADTPQYGINWGDGTVPTFGSSGEHTYAEPGEYEICAYYTDIFNVVNCTVSDCENVEIAVGVEEHLLNLSGLVAMPNPVADYTQISFSLNKSASIQIDVFDLVGNKIETIMVGDRGQGLHNYRLDSERLSSGVYIVRVLAGEEHKSISIMKQ